MKIFITGATGFIGSHLVSLLARSPHELVCLVRPGRSVPPAWPRERCRPAIGDVTDRASLVRGMKGCRWAVC